MVPRKPLIEETFLLRDWLRYRNCWIDVEKGMFLSFFPLSADLTKAQGTMAHLNMKTRGAVLSLRCHFALSYVIRKKFRPGSLFWLIYQNAKQKKLGTRGGRLQHGSRTDVTTRSVLSVLKILSAQGKEAAHCHFDRKTFNWLPSGECGVTRVTTGSNWCTTNINGASLLDLLLEKQVWHHAVFLPF